MAVWQFGVLETREITVAALDRLHLFGPHTRLLRETRRLEHANPMRDAERALGRSEFGLIGVNFCETLQDGTSQTVPRFPGIDPALFDPYSQRYGILSMTAGGLDWPEFLRYQSALVSYAEKYNRTVVQRSGR